MLQRRSSCLSMEGINLCRRAKRFYREKGQLIRFFGGGLPHIFLTSVSQYGNRNSSTVSQGGYVSIDVMPHW